MATDPVPVVNGADAQASSAEERYYIASQRQLMWRKFRKHRMAVFAGVILLIAYLAAFTFEFCAPYGPLTQHEGYVHAPPTRVRLIDADGRLRAPFVYGLTGQVNLDTFQREFVEDRSVIHSLRFLPRGEPYRFWGAVNADLHLFDAGEGRVFPVGHRRARPRPVLARPCWQPGESDHRPGGRDDQLRARLSARRHLRLLRRPAGTCSFSASSRSSTPIPGIPLWMALSAVIPVNWPVLRTYFTITLILSVLGWTGVARVVRGKLLELREYDYVTAARLAGTRGRDRSSPPTCCPAS